MDIVYASLGRKEAAGPAPDGEAAEVLAALWAHARPTDALQHITVRCEPERVDLLLYLLTRPTAAPAPAPAPVPAADLPARAPSEDTAKDPLAVAHDLVTRSHQASPTLRWRYYWRPIPPAAR
ncbi:hypothetical protein Kpho02_25800 [Kitasatospora phosalacinea]|uniref:Uncharacterized protein n=1 Tax=Kitasatospora phosalacinea TaxID=2065 RepID=A0A9W6Q878_9ACTN|nr:hypothetical protein [Kitasatospora phosalacinea]GLW70281.1 hypothetical protein Kpho02_25800 [Kitasatospora phosalacinea]